MADAPNHGLMLTEDGEVVGANLAFYSEREINGRQKRFCNLGALCVVESRRAHAVRLVRAVLRQPALHGSVTERECDRTTCESFRDHHESPVARHLLVASGQDLCYVSGRRDRRKKSIEAALEPVKLVERICKGVCEVGS
jgi:hypothetical protein